jgi:hypothetical protein
VKKLVGAYDTHFGVRSVVHEVQRIAVQLVADAHIQGRLKAKWVFFPITSPCAKSKKHWTDESIDPALPSWLAHLQLNAVGDIELVAADSRGTCDSFTVKR